MGSEYSDEDYEMDFGWSRGVWNYVAWGHPSWYSFIWDGTEWIE